MRILFISGLLLCLAGCISATQIDSKTWYAKRSLPAPSQTKLYICHGTGCALRERVNFGPQDIARLKQILQKRVGSPQAERQAISRAVQWFEKRVGPQVGSTHDVGGFDFSTVNKPGQMDCIDESTNTTSLLKLLQNNGLLRHHTVGRPVARGFLLDGRYPHATAVIIEKNTKTAYAVDSWVRDNGQRPDIMALKIWLKKRSTSR